MKEFFGLIIYTVCLVQLSYMVGVDNTTITPEKVSFAESSCKLGEWDTIDKNVITCNDGAIYEYNLEK